MDELNDKLPAGSEKWISVTDGLPGLSVSRWPLWLAFRKSPPLLVLTRFGSCETGELREYPFGIHWTGKSSLATITHWRLVPKPPVTTPQAEKD